MTEYKGKRNTEEEVIAVIKHICELVDTDQVVPGGRLPAERKISADTGVSRAKVRLALERLESYGALKILPQSGSVLSPLSKTALIRQMTNIIEGVSFDFNSLVQVRNILEEAAVRFCAVNHTPEDVILMEQAYQDFVDHVHGPLRDEKDFAFHSTIARCCHNPVIYHLLLMIAPDVLHYYRSLKACTVSPETVSEEHRLILDRILASDPVGAEEALKYHLSAITEFASGSKQKIHKYIL
ncbi:MAG: FadR family transcriptional regulator [Bacteroidales bacterium]|nr:FadR family transcriptional regulator [Bacteroidales bacterium]